MTKRGLRSHPARDAIFDAMRQYGKPISPTQLARVTGDTLGSTAYHVRTLLAAEMIELVDEARVRGTVEHFYTLPAGTEAGAPIDAARQLLSVCGALTVSGSDGGYPVPTELDDDARAELGALLNGLRPQVQQIAAESTARVRQQRG